jgi:site-specific DNA-methyltransferase (adenine-specific)
MSIKNLFINCSITFGKFMNTLYFADCLDALKDLYHHNPDGFIDLIYIDPPFNSKRNYNILFESINLKDTKAQREAFADTWSNVSYLDTLNEIQNLDLDLYKFLNALDSIRISKGAISYLTTMAIRLYYIHKVLKDTGSFYLHCDPTMSHYLKLVCDLIFGEKNFRNEIIWKRMTASGFKGKKDLGTSHDVILRYSKSDNFTYFPIMRDYSEEYIKTKFAKIDENKRYFKDEKIGTATSAETIERLKQEGKIYTTSTGKLRIKHYLDEANGFPIDDVWTDLSPVNSQASERLGYPTQKPEALLERIIKSSSNEGDLIADFFCGCGTTIASAQKLKRKWLGVDISHLAIKLIIDRLTDPYPTARAKTIRENIQILGFPRDIDGAKMLARETDNGRFGFQDWIIEVMLGGISNQKKTADGGFDGYITFYKSEKEKGLSIIEVKSGNVNVKNVREFIQVVKNQQADTGVFVCFNEQVTKPMLLEAKKEGYFAQELFGNRYDKIQILTVEEILEGKDINLPMEFFKKNVFKTATKSLNPEVKQDSFFE